MQLSWSHLLRLSRRHGHDLRTCSVSRESNVLLNGFLRGLLFGKLALVGATSSCLGAWISQCAAILTGEMGPRCWDQSLSATPH
jgi:hypothetical protein